MCCTRVWLLSIWVSGFKPCDPSRSRRLWMSDQITPSQFEESPGVEDWRVLGDGANAFYRTDSMATAARFVQAISELPDADNHPPDIDVRRDGVTVRLITFTSDFGGMITQDL